MLVSVIIPTLNRARLLKRTLFSLFEQTSAHAFEVIVVDNGSTDHTRAVVEGYQRQNGASLSYVFDDRPGLLVGRNVGAHRAQGDILSFIDDDVIVPPFWADGIVEVFGDDQVHLATGNTYPFFECTPPEWINHLWCPYRSEGRYLYQLSLLDLGLKSFEIDAYLVWGLNYHIRKKVYFEVGGFNPDIISPDLLDFIGDGETGVAEKIAGQGYRAFFDPKISLYHTVTPERLTPDYFLRRSFTEGMMRGYSEMRSPESAEDTSGILRALRLPIRAARKIRNSVNSGKKSLQNPELVRVQNGIVRSFRDGYADYIKRFEANPLLMQYVQEENYLDIDAIAKKYYHRT